MPSESLNTLPSGLSAYADLVIDQRAVLSSIGLLQFDRLPGLADLSPGQDIAPLLHGLADSLTEAASSPEGAPVSYPLELAGQALIVNLCPMAHRAGHFQLRIYPDSLGLNHIYRQQRHLEIISRSLYESSLDAIITIDGDSAIREFGSSAEKLFGYSRAEVLGKNVADVVIPPQMRQAHHDGMNRFHVTRDGPVLNTRIEVSAIRRDGSEFPCELTVVPTAQFEGETFFTATIRDISERKARERALEKARTIAEASNQAKSRFLAHMSHEIRSPLSAIIGCMDLLLDSQLNNEQANLTQTSLNAGHGLLGMIEDILDFSKIEAGQLQTNFSNFNLLDLCERVLEVVSVRAATKNIEISASFDPGIPAQVSSDQGFIRRILTNLLDNAIKFTERGGVTLSVTVHNDSQTHTDILFEVRDTGIGIAQENQHQLFKEFSQVDNSDSTEYGGTGLGLAICQKLAEQLQGHISVSSEVSKGSTFRVVVPVTIVSNASPALAPIALDRHLYICSSNASLKRSLNAQCKLLELPCSIVSADELPKLSPRENDLVFIDLNGDIGLSAWLKILSGTGLNAAQVALYRHEFSAEDVLALTQSGFIHWLTRPLRPSALLGCFNKPETNEPTLKQAKAITQYNEHRILLAEDSKANQLVAKTMLDRAGYQLDIVENGAEAVAAVKSGQYHLVLMDLRMPELDGLEAARQIRELPSPLAKLPIIAMTANAFDSDKTRCLEAGMDDFLTKPVNHDQLLSCLSHWLGGERREPAEAIGEVAPIQAVDLDESIVSRLEADTTPEAAAMIMKMVVTELEKLKQAIIDSSKGSADLKQLRDLAHASKSSCGYCGASAVQNYCQRLEIACDVQDEAELAQLLAGGEALLEAGQQAINDYLSR